MRCSNCGHELPEGVRFCTKCGTPVAPSGPVDPYAPTEMFSQPPAPASQPTAPVAQATSAFSQPQPTVSFGAQTPQPQQAFAGGGMVQQQKRGMSGCAKAFIVFLIVGLGLLGLAGAGGYYLYRVANEKLRSSEAYTVAVAALKNDPNAADKLGTVTETGFPLGAFSENADGSGDAGYHLSVKGTKASGTYDVAMARRAGKWYLVTGKLTLEDGEVVTIKSPARPGSGSENSNDGFAPPPPDKSGRGAGTTISGGALDEKATSKPEPAYPAVAKAANASGKVVVQVTVDEQGNVVSAAAVSGHPLLRAAAQQAARQAHFAPTLLSGRPVKVNGTLSYDFEPEQ